MAGHWSVGHVGDLCSNNLRLYGGWPGQSLILPGGQVLFKIRDFLPPSQLLLPRAEPRLLKIFERYCYVL